MRDKLKNMDSETMAFSTINMNSFSDAPSLQGTLEQPLEKKSGQPLHEHTCPPTVLAVLQVAHLNLCIPVLGHVQVFQQK